MLQCEFDKTIYKTCKFSKTFLRNFPGPDFINQMRGIELTHSKIYDLERSIEGRILNFFDQISTKQFSKTIQLIPQLRVQSIMWKNQLGDLFFSLEFLDRLNQARVSQSVILKNALMIMPVAGYIHSKALSILPSCIQNNHNYSHECFLQWFEGLLFSNKDGSIPILKCVSPEGIKTTEMIFSSVQRYIIPKISKTQRKIHSAIIGIAVYQHWLHEECSMIWNYFITENLFPNLIESFFQDVRNTC